MTTTTKTRKTPSTKTTDVAAFVAAGTVTIEAVDVATARLDPNVRTDTTYTAEFADSVKTYGVREPVYARRDTDGTVYVWDGQRRTLAAQQAGTPTMLAIFGLTPTTMKDSQRILDQLRTFNRSDLTLADRITAYEQLALDGISETAIVRAAGESRDLVKKSLTVAHSASAKQAAQDRGSQVSLDKLILIAEFDGDQDAIDQISHIEHDDDLPCVAQQIRDDRRLREVTAQLVDTYAATGVQVFTEWDRSFRTLDRLTDATGDAEDRPPLTAETHAACEGRALCLSVWGDGENDHRVEEVCARPDLYHDRWGGPSAASGAIPVDETEEQRQEREDAEAIERKAERARVLANNKAWRTAVTVRRGWIVKLLTRKTLPKDALVFVALTLTAHAHTITDYKSGDLVGTFLSQDGDLYPRASAARLVEATPTKAGHVTLAVALAARETRAEDVNGWWNPSTEVGSSLLALEAWGYKLSPVERIAAGYPKAIDEDRAESPADDPIAEDGGRHPSDVS